jgi:DNA-directed RNA polymerase specialized sigma24 family protein
LKIALNEAKDRVKSRSNQSRQREIRVGDSIDQFPASTTSTPDDDCAGGNGVSCKLINDLDSCLSRLSETEREVLLADASSSGNIADSQWLAEKLSKEEGTIRVARKRGLDKLRRFFVELGYIIN